MSTNPLVEKITDGEAEIMKVVWQAGRPIPFVEIRSALQSRDPSKESPTINTMINRLVKKGVLRQEQQAVYYYSPLVDEAEYREFKTKAFLDKIYDGNTRDLLASLASYRGLSESDLDELRDILRQGGDGDA